MCGTVVRTSNSSRIGGPHSDVFFALHLRSAIISIGNDIALLNFYIFQFYLINYPEFGKIYRCRHLGTGIYDD